MNQTLSRMLVKLANEKREDWDLYIDSALYAYRVSRHDSTKYTPFFLMYNRNPSLLVHCEIPKEMTDGKGKSLGLNGKEWSTGLDGEEGSKGLNGEEGSTGLDGEEGSKGVNGEDRSPGLDEEEGSTGLDGEEGSKGLDGEEGSTGLDDEKRIASGSKRSNSSDIRNAGLDYKELSSDLNRREKVCDLLV